MKTMIRALSALWVLPVALPVWVLWVLPAWGFGLIGSPVWRGYAWVFEARFDKRGSWWRKMWFKKDWVWYGVALPLALLKNPEGVPDGWLEHEIRRLEHKIAEGAQFAITQPVYDLASARSLSQATEHLAIPILLGLLPLRSARHAEFLHHRVAGIAISDTIQQRMTQAADPRAEGIALAREMASAARDLFSGLFIMPPFGHYEILSDILA